MQNKENEEIIEQEKKEELESLKEKIENSDSKPISDDPETNVKENLNEFVNKNEDTKNIKDLKGISNLSQIMKSAKHTTLSLYSDLLEGIKTNNPVLYDILEIFKPVSFKNKIEESQSFDEDKPKKPENPSDKPEEPVAESQSFETEEPITESQSFEAEEPIAESQTFNPSPVSESFESKPVKQHNLTTVYDFKPYYSKTDDIFSKLEDFKNRDNYQNSIDFKGAEDHFKAANHRLENQYDEIAPRISDNEIKELKDIMIEAKHNGKEFYTEFCNKLSKDNPFICRLMTEKLDGFGDDVKNSQNEYDHDELLLMGKDNVKNWNEIKGYQIIISYKNKIENPSNGLPFHHDILTNKKDGELLTKNESEMVFKEISNEDATNLGKLLKVARNQGDEVYNEFINDLSKNNKNLGFLLSEVDPYGFGEKFNEQYQKNNPLEYEERNLNINLKNEIDHNSDNKIGTNDLNLLKKEIKMNSKNKL